jgi:hypothetical protein
MKVNVLAAASLLVCLGLLVPRVQAQGNCSLETITGTYAFEERGAVELLSLPTTAPVIVPFANLGEINLTPKEGNGSYGSGFYWGQRGAGSAANDNPPKETVTIDNLTINADCTGTVTYTLDQSGAQIVEDLFVFDEGREARSVLHSFTPANPDVINLMAWTGTFHRIAKRGEAVNCGPQTGAGTWLTTGEGITAVPSGLFPSITDPALYGKVITRFHCSLSGDCAGGPLYEKFGAFSSGAIKEGHVTTFSDCSFEGSIIFAGEPNTTYQTRGVFFDQGRQFYSLMFGPSDGTLEFAPSQGTLIGK